MATGETSAPNYNQPKLPSIREIGIDIDSPAWRDPYEARTNSEVVLGLLEGVAKVANDPEMQKRAVRACRLYVDMAAQGMWLNGNPVDDASVDGQAYEASRIQMDFAARVIGNFGDVSALRRIFQEGARVGGQADFHNGHVRHGNHVVQDYYGPWYLAASDLPSIRGEFEDMHSADIDEIGTAANCALLIAEKLYAQRSGNTYYAQHEYE